MASQSSGLQNGRVNARFETIGAHRLGLKLTAGVFSVVDANGLDLSNLNLGYVAIPNKTLPGLLNTYAINANQSFSDSASGGSTIIGNLFGTTTADIWATDVPFYLYACIDDANSTPIFGISRVPNLVQAPAAGNIGTPASATAGVSYGMFLFSSVTIANYDLNPVVCLGSFRMRKIAGDDWTVQAFGNSDGFGRFQENLMFTLPAGVNGNASGAYFIDNGGTAPTFVNNFLTYKLNKDGMLWFTSLMFNDPGAGTAGLGAVTLTHNNVIELAGNQFAQSLYPGYGGYQNSPGNPFNDMGPVVAGTNIQFRLNENTTNLLQNVNFDGTAGYSIEWAYHAPVRTF
jgi:hypothetical protein